MSQREVLATLRGALQDPATGLAARIAALATSSAIPTEIRTDLHFVPWKLSGTVQRATSPNVMIRPGQWRAQLKEVYRAAQCLVQVGMEWFDADVAVIQENVTIAATALLQVLDALRAYSDAHGGPIVDVVDPTVVDFGEFTGPVSAGFIATITLEEQSRE